MMHFGVKKSLDYVVVVIGIFVALVEAYWRVYGSRFEGPVSSYTHNNIRAPVMHCY